MTDVAPADKTNSPRIVPDQLLVATPYVSAVIAKLNSPTFMIYVGAEHTEDWPPLGLTRIKFAGSYEGAPAALKHDAGAGVLNIDAVIKQLRAEFGEENAGWCPTMGKNRALSDNIIGGGSMIYKGVDDPKVIPTERLSAVEAKWNRERPVGPGEGIRVGMVDTRVLQVPPLDRALNSDSDFLPLDETATRAGHATFVAGLIFSVAPGATIKVRGILDKNGVSDSWEAAKAIVDLGNSVDILNLSFGCITGDGRPPLALATAIDLIDPKTVIVAAAGNFDPDGPPLADIDQEKDVDVRRCASFPAALDNVVAVGSASGGRIADYSPHGLWVDAYADGGGEQSGVESTYLLAGDYQGFATWKGTSFAAAMVTGAIAAEMIAGEESAHRAWMAVKDRLGLGEVIVPERLGISLPQRILTHVIDPEQWFNERSVNLTAAVSDVSAPIISSPSGTSRAPAG